MFSIGREAQPKLKGKLTFRHSLKLTFRVCQLKHC